MPPFVIIARKADTYVEPLIYFQSSFLPVV